MGGSWLYSISYGKLDDKGIRATGTFYWNKDWKVVGLSAGPGYGERWTLFNQQGGVSGVFGIGVTGYKKTSERSWFDIISNHYLFNPMIP